MLAIVLQYAVPLGLAALLLGAIELGAQIARRSAKKSGTSKSKDYGAVQGAMLGLLGLLLGFSFAGASSRYMERQDLITHEANAIETLFYRADLFEEQYRLELQSELRSYVDSRVERSKTLHNALTDQEIRAFQDAHKRIWEAAVAGVTANPAVTNTILNPTNAVFDLHTARIAAADKHLPGLVLGLLIACSILTLTTIGYATGGASRRPPLLASAIAILICAALWTTIDLDRPRIGLIRIDDSAIIGIQTSFAE